MNQKYIKNLENVIKQMLTPLKGIPLNLVIESLSGHKIIPFDQKNQKDSKLLSKLVKTANIAGKEINKKGIKRPRPNEVGNDIELFVKRALGSVGYKAGSPFAKSGKKKAMGYPDLEFVDNFGRTNYLECKTFNVSNISSKQRTFYLSPSDDFKVTKDAHHFVISFEIFVHRGAGKNNIYKCKSWKILTIDSLEVDVKYEFNSDNERMYQGELILAEGKL